MLNRKTQTKMATKTKALLIGINDYSPARPGGSDLNGCINDVKDMANTLIICGYSPAKMKILTDQRATRNGILSGINWLLSGAKKGDSLTLYYSGHGSYRTDFDGDEPDGRDELICPHDWPNYISDDDFKKIFSSLKSGINLEVFFDCCNSGTGTRAALRLPEESEGPILTPRFIPPPFDDTFYQDFKVSFNRPTKRFFAKLDRTKEIKMVPGLNHVLWSGCRDYQLSNETRINGKIRGVFTYHLCSVLRAASGDISRKKLDTLVTAAVARYGFDQTPQLEANAAEFDQKIFT